MSIFAGKFRNVAARYSRQGAYEVADGEPSFFVKAIPLNGVSVSDVTLQDAKRVLADILPLNLEAVDVCLLISHIEGLKVLTKSGQEIAKYDVPDIAFGGIDAEYPNYLVVVGCMKEEKKCHIYLCDSPSHAKEILFCLNKSFQNAKEIFGVEDERVSVASVFIPNDNEESTGPADFSNPDMKSYTSTSTRKANEKGSRARLKTDSGAKKNVFTRLAPRSQSDAAVWKSSVPKGFSRNRKTSYNKLGTDSESAYALF